jgi:hypothetical protein
MRKNRRLLDEYRYPGFHPRAAIHGIFGDPQARVIQLIRRQKKRPADAAVRSRGAITTRRCEGYEICPAGMYESIWRWKYAGYSAGSVVM